MADKNTGWACTHSASIIAEDNSGVTIRVICYWKNQGWRYDMNGVSAWVYCAGQEVCVKSSSAINTTGDNQGSYEMGRHDFYIAKNTSVQPISCYAKITSTSSYVSGTKSSSASSMNIAAKPSYTVSYNANGGSGAPGNQTKWYGSNLTLSSTKPTRTGHTFNGWATSASGSVAYQPGATYTANASVTLYAKWTAYTYTVSYNANGGSGAPGNQTKTYGVNLTLSSTKPTKANYNFKGWSTSANGSVVYAPGATYTNNSAVTLYAVWELAYVKPRITNFNAQRCNSDGTVSETGTYVKVTFNWATDKDVENIYIDWADKPNSPTFSNKQVIASGRSGSVSQVIGDGNISVESSYYVRAWVKDGGNSDGSLSPTVVIGTVKFPIDVKNGGKGVAFGKVAEQDDLLDVAWDVKIAGHAKAKSINAYFSGVIHPAAWFHIGYFKFKDQGQYATIDCYTGEGQNGNADQNTHFIITLKQGWTSSELPIGITTTHLQNRRKEYKIAISHLSANECNLYIYLPFNYNDLTFIVNGSYDVFTLANVTLDSAPTTDKESAHYIIDPRRFRAFRQTDANVAATENACAMIEHYGATDDMTSNKPSLGNGHILHFHWDNTNGYDTQLFMKHSSGQIMTRGCNAGTWGNWGKVYQVYTLYDNTSGTSGSITLKVNNSAISCTNFTFLRIYFMDQDGAISSVEVPCINGKMTRVSIQQLGASQLYIAGAEIKMTDSVLSFNWNRRNTAWATVTSGSVKVIKVEGVR